MGQQSLDIRLVEIFEQELWFQGHQAMVSVRFLNENLRGGFESDVFWHHMNAALGSMAALGNILWPQQDRKVVETDGPRMGSKLRGRLLREHLGLGDPKLAGLHDVRNGFVHFDERIDKWFAASKSKSFADHIVAAPGVVELSDNTGYARIYDPSGQTVSVFGAQMNLQQAVLDVSELLGLVRDCDHTELHQPSS